MRKSPTASARPSLRQGGRNTPLATPSPPSENREERPSILSLFFVVLLTFSFITALVTALFFAYAHEIEQRPLPTAPPANASTQSTGVPRPPTAPPTVAKPGARKATQPRETSRRPSKRTKKRRRRKRPATVSHTPPPSSSEEAEDVTTTAEMGHDRFTEGVGPPEVDSAEANATRSPPETASPVSQQDPRDETGLWESSSTDGTTTLDELTNDEATDTYEYSLTWRRHAIHSVR
ncbi:hypothetical protein HPB51_023865 [Rhipicephalus microplus]|uniref:Transmembrane protein n=1 Tax=Rhipicephalus microplus TaxID=6941 RepID=A0A9J6F870_RHIMP|nr:hypothetical protein HPB51_023865 [Rhipicephalus microplus]